jgi:hypothetical protein
MLVELVVGKRMQLRFGDFNQLPAGSCRMLGVVDAAQLDDRCLAPPVALLDKASLAAKPERRPWRKSVGKIG